MGRRVLAFFLGFLVGIVFIFGSLALAIYVTATVVHPKDIYPDSSKFLGDLADMSLYDIYQSIAELYREKVGVTDEEGRYFTFGQFCEHYNINPNELFGGKEVPQDVLDVPIFEFFGENGKDPAMQQIKVSALFAFVNMFAAGQDGNGFFSQNALAKLSAHSMAELSDSEKGFKYVFEEVLIADLLPTTFPQEKEGNNAVMWALGQSSIGRLMGGIQGSILLQFKEGGVFEAMGSLRMTELLGNSSSIVNALFNNSRFADLIDDNGNVNFDGFMDNVYLGNLFDYQRGIYEGDIDGFTVVSGDEDRALLAKGEGDEQVLILRFPAAVDGEYEYYEANFTCLISEHTHDESCGEPNEEGQYPCLQTAHTHDHNCYEFVWYRCNGVGDESHEHTSGCLAVGMMAKLANEKVMELGELDATIKTFTLYDVMGESVPRMLKSIQDKPISELGGAIDAMYLGDFLEYHRLTPDNLDGESEEPAEGIKQYVGESGEILYAKLDTDGIWYSANFDCTNDEHGDADHDASCYMYIWYTFSNNGEEGTTYKEVGGVMGRLASIRIGELNGAKLTEVVDNTRLGDVISNFGDNAMLRELADVRIGKLSTELNALYVGSAMGYFREEISAELNPKTDLNQVDNTTNVYVDNANNYYRYDTKKGKYYDAVLNCAESHSHEDKCFGYAWYKCKNNGEAHTEDCIVRGLNGKMSNLSMLGLSNNELQDVLTSLTIGDLIDSGMINPIEGEEAYKMSIIACKTDEHDCSLGGYFTAYALQQGSLTPAEYWKQQHNCSDRMTQEDAAHRDAWRNLKLAQFINELLGAI